ncbi:E3 ubiquitin-protein ligase RNF125 isoform X1 [Symphalangus syndactylus]|uniref:E3 ubiquitin-protein ligase RNF125 isoform X1 n=1 Tax=Symphalangus syndactylus TaxID=9590 RepID=UPI0030053EDD
MGSVLSSDSGKSAPASATPRALERRGYPELPVTSFDCAVCLEVLHQPVRTRCGHVFCRSCIATSLKNNKWTCPYCRAYLPSEGVPATDVAKRMKSEYENCTECDTLVCLSEMRAHIRTCQKYIDKYGPLQELEETAARCVCPFCQRELDKDSLLDHYITHHRSEWRPVNCPRLGNLGSEERLCPATHRLGSEERLCPATHRLGSEERLCPATHLLGSEERLCPATHLLGSEERLCPATHRLGSEERLCPATHRLGSEERLCPATHRLGSEERLCPATHRLGSEERLCPAALSGK